MNKLILLGIVLAAIGCGGGNANNDGATASGTAGAGGGGGSGPCTTGAEGCPCYGNDTCNGTLQCFSHLCVSVTGTGGSATGTGGSATGTGGSATGTGGSAGSGTGAGGSATGTAGTAGTNLIKNGDFSQGKTYWDLTYQAGEVAGSQYDAGEYCILNLSSSLYLSFSLGYPPTPSDAFVIQPSTNYTLTYRARFQAGTSGAALPAVTVKIGHASPPYDMLVQFAGDTISTNYTTFSHAINSPTGDTGAGLVFNGTLDYLTEVCFDDVTLIKN